ncbi:MAG: sulfotransferase [Bacteroidetes bacterium]|nr:sulfotransferase [Bacteroidota bacterium]
MKHSYLTAGMTSGRLFSILTRNKISWDPGTLLRILFLLQSSLWSSLFSSLENVRFGKRIKQAPCPVDPVFIIGHWRTGTTLLYKLMSLDEQFTAPTLFQVAEPDSLLTSHSYYKPIMQALVKKTRPMDNVKVGMDEPQEDEYAIFRLTGTSPLEQLIFPQNGKYFVEEWAKNERSDKTNELIKKELKSFFRKITYVKKGIILSKNPFHSFRLDMLLEAFPKARFIQIHRHPFDVVPSTMNMWYILQKENALNRVNHKFNIYEICRGMNLISEKITIEASALTPGSYAETRFEDLENDPVMTVKQIYTQLGLVFSERQANLIKEYTSLNRNFRKNNFSLSESEKATIKSELKEYMRKYAYS